MNGIWLARSRPHPKMGKAVPSVHLGFCHTGFVYTPFMMSVLAWERYEAQNNQRLPAYSAIKHPVIADSRNDLVRKFLKSGEEWLWMLDPDIQFPPETCVKLMGLADPDTAPIVAAAYWNDVADQRCLTWHAQTEEGLRTFRRLPEVDGGIVLGSCGMGCTLIHRRVLRKMQEVLSDDPWPWFGHDLVDKPTGAERAGEDVTFCIRARELGFRIVGHCGVTVEHYKPGYVAHGGVKGD